MKLCYYIFFSLTILTCSITPYICGPGFFGPLQLIIISLSTTNIQKIMTPPLLLFILGTSHLSTASFLLPYYWKPPRSWEYLAYIRWESLRVSARPLGTLMLTLPAFSQTLQMKMHPWYRQLELEKLQSANSNMALTPVLTKSTSTWLKISLLQPGPEAPPHRSWAKFMLQSWGKYFTF